MSAASEVCLHRANYCGFSAFFYITVATHMLVHDVCVIQLNNNAALIVQIYINHEEKNSYSQQDVSAWLEGGCTVFFLGFVRM